MGWGNPNYHAKPDVMQMRLSTKSDLWMLAQTAAHLWTGYQPAMNPVRLPSNIPMKAVLERCLSNDPSQRPTASQVLNEIRCLIPDATPAPQPKAQPTKTAAPQTKYSMPTKAATQQPKYSMPKENPKTEGSKYSMPAAKTAMPHSQPERVENRSFGNKINHNNEKVPTKKAEKVEKGSRSPPRSPIEEVSYIFTGRRSPQPYGGNKDEAKPNVHKTTATKATSEPTYTKQQEEVIEQEINELQAEFERKTKMSSFEDFNRRLDALKAKVMGDEKAWRNMDTSSNNAGVIA